MNNQKRTPYFLFLALLVAGCFLISPVANTAATSSGSSQEVSQLLSQVKTEAIALEQDSDQLAVWARTKQGAWQSHADRLTLIREHINTAGQLLTQLNEARETASPWQHQAIDRIYPLLKELADNTEATINHLNDNRNNIRFPEYRDYAKAGADLAQELAELVRDYVEYGEHEAEFHRLQEKLESAAS
jgi:chromosome segregation ATPase